MLFGVQLLPEALDDIQSAPTHLRPRLKRAIDALAATPRPTRSVELRGYDNYLRTPVADWRVVYHVDDGEKLVTVLAVRRKTGPETYEELPQYP